MDQSKCFLIEQEEIWFFSCQPRQNFKIDGVICTLPLLSTPIKLKFLRRHYIYLKPPMEIKESSGTELRLVFNRPVSSTTRELRRRSLLKPKYLEVKFTVDEVVDWLSLRLPDPLWSPTRNFIISYKVLQLFSFESSINIF